MGLLRAKNSKKIIKDKRSPFKASLFHAPLAEPVSNIMGLLQDQFHKGLLGKVTGDLGKLFGRQDVAQ